VSFRLLKFTLLAGLLAFASNAQAGDLQAALISVYESNPRLLAERARLREIDETYVQARALGRPTVGGTGSISQSFVNFPGGASVFSNGLADGDINISGRPNEIGVQVVQPLYQGGRVKALKTQAKLGILAARETLRGQENNLFLSAANAYVDVRRDTEAVRIRRNNVRVLMRQLEAATARFEVGAGTRTDIAQSEARLAVSEAGLSLPDAIAAARENNPQLISAYYNEAAGRAAIDVAKAAGRPTVSITGGLTRQREQLSQLQSIDAASISAQVTIPIYSGGGNTSRRRQAEHAKTRLAFETRDAELGIDQAISQIWAQLIAALDVLNAEQETLNAQLSVIDAERNVQAATFQLLATIGVFDAQGIQLPVEGYNLNDNLNVIRYQGLTEQVDRFAPGFIKRLDRKLPGEVTKPDNWDDENVLSIQTEPVQGCFK